MSATTYVPTQSSYRVSDLDCNRYAAQPTIDPFVTFADNFDLSLLPQETTATAASDTNIPTTVYQYNDSSNNYNNTSSSSTAPPTIKIETSWCKSEELDTQPKAQQSYSLLYEQLSRQPADNKPTAANQLIPPPPAYPSIYPSPQSSPSQSEYHFSYTPNSSGYDSLTSSRASLYSTSPCPSLDASSIKQELHILPPSPPESNCEAHSPRSSCADIKCEPFESDVEGTLIDLNTLLESSSAKQTERLQPVSDNQLTEASAQRKYNLKSLALESFIDGLEADSEDFEPVISLALQHVKREADAVCARLQISQDPTAWSTIQVHAWLRSTIEQFKLQHIENLEGKFNENGANLILLSEEEFMQRAPECGSILHAQLEIWKLAYSEDYKCNVLSTQMYGSAGNSNNNGDWAAATTMHAMSMDVDAEIDDEHDATTMQAESGVNQTTNYGADKAAEACQANTNNSNAGNAKCVSMMNNTNAMDTTVTATAATTSTAATPAPQRNGGSHIHLWQFLKELLQSPHLYGTAIRWIDRSKGIFKIEDSVRVAKLWGKRKNRPAMNYDKLSRSIRQYYKKGIMKKTERSQRLVYQFCHPYYL